MIKKITALLLALLMLLPTVVACSKDKEEEKGNDSVTTSSDNSESGLLISDKLKDVSFNGETVNIWQVTNASNAAEYFYDMNGDIASTDLVSKKIYERNAAVESYLNLKIEFVDTGSYTSNAATDCRTYLQAGTSEFDAYSLIQWNGIELVKEGWFRNLDDLEYFDFDAEWWSQDFMNAAKINGHNYIMAGDVNIDMVSCAAAVFVNKKLLTDTYGDNAYNELREKVLKGKGEWTVDDMVKYSKGMYLDLNNNNTVDLEDQFGFLFNSSNNVDGFFFGMGGTSIERDANGQAVATIGSDRNTEILEKLMAVAYPDTPDDYGHYAGTQQIQGATLTQPVVKKFAQGQTLFCTGFLYTARNLTDMTDGFGVLPFPKYNTDQESYRSIIHNIVTIYAIPKDCTKTAQTSAAFEAMASMGKQQIVPYYYETVLKVRYIDDPDDAKLIDTIYNARMSDIGVIFSSTAFEIPRNAVNSGYGSMPYYVDRFKGEIKGDLEAINGLNFE